MSEQRVTILFVDDERPILDGLRRKLWDQEDHWDMIFIDGGAAALAVMAQRRVDVIVTDMRMPGMDGAVLLEEVQRRYPETARFILSGFSEREALFRALGPAHQYFVKPCDSGSLVQAVQRSLAIRSQVKSPEMLAMISGANGIPAFPQALAELLEHLRSSDGSVAEVTRIISSDIGLTAQLLKIVNSSYFFIPTKVMDVGKAVRLLGFDLVRSVALLAGIFNSFPINGIDLAAVQRLQNRSVTLGAVARKIAVLEGLDKVAVDQSQCAGMLAHVGSLILFAHQPDKMAKMQRELDASGAEIITMERQYFGASHPQLGGSLLSLWGFNDLVVEAVLHHHCPSECQIFDNENIGALSIVHAAQYLVTPVASSGDVARRAGLDLEHLGRVGAIDHIDRWAEEAIRTNKESAQ